MDANEKTQLTESAKCLSDFLEVDFRISIFGHTIIEWHFPPKRK